jgi:hypothetical protein
MRTVGPVAAAFGGQGEMSGLPEPAMPVGWGYSYLDWMGAYGYALALYAARWRSTSSRNCSGSKCCIITAIGNFGGRFPAFPEPAIHATAQPPKICAPVRVGAGAPVRQLFLV